MGAASSIHPELVKSIEVSFVNERTGKLMSEYEIQKVNEKIFKEFDYKPSFYDGYKVKDNKNPYDTYAEYLKSGYYK
jgi:hypothetical protein